MCVSSLHKYKTAISIETKGSRSQYSDSYQTQATVWGRKGREKHCLHSNVFDSSFVQKGLLNYYVAQDPKILGCLHVLCYMLI